MSAPNNVRALFLHGILALSVVHTGLLCVYTGPSMAESVRFLLTRWAIDQNP